MKLCLFCKHIGVNESHHYSEDTREYYSIDCSQNHFDIYDPSLSEMRGWAERAETCPDYELDPTITEENS